MVNIDGINEWLSSEEACRRLGVRSQTLYAYVSRGRLTPRKDGRRSLFHVDELDRLAANGRRGSRSGRLEVLIDTELTLLDPKGRFAYRGVDVVEVATRWSYERAAEWLWSSYDGEPVRWEATAEWAALARAVGGNRPTDRLRAATAAISAVAERQVEDVVHVGRALVPSLLEVLPVVKARPAGRIAGIDRDDALAARLWPRLTALAPTPDRLAVLNAALVLLADHEMAVSALAARVAASAWAPPVDVVLAGLSAHGGALHCGITMEAESGLRRGDVVHGFGHPVYVGQDPRAVALLDLLRSELPASRWTPIDRASRSGPAPANIDFALAALAVGFDMVPDASGAVFALSRVAGWLAHGAEEYQRPFRFRARASYVGPPLG